MICQELERGDSGLRSFVSVQSSLCMYPIHTYGSEEQRQKYLPGMARGEIIGCFGLTEPHGGSDPVNMKTHAKRRGDDWVINGAKMWITNAPIADVFVVWAKTEEGIRGFLLDRGAKGLATPEIEKKFSLRASATGALFFEDVVVPAENMLPGSTVGLKAPLSCLTQARYGITWGVIGAAQACLREALEYSKTRVLFGKPIAATQAVQIRLAEMARKITTAQLLSLQLGRLKDAGTDVTVPGVARQVEQLPRGHRNRARRARHPRRRRHQRGVRADPSRAEPRERDHVRRHRDDSPAHGRSRADGHQRVSERGLMAGDDSRSLAATLRLTGVTRRAAVPRGAPSNMSGRCVPVPVNCHRNLLSAIFTKEQATAAPTLVAESPASTNLL